MAEAVVGRKRTYSGVLIEVRALADRQQATPEELTEYVATLIAAADVVCEELRRRREAMAALAAGVQLAASDARELAAAYRDYSADWPAHFPCGCAREQVERGDCTIFDPHGKARPVGA